MKVAVLQYSELPVLHYSEKPIVEKSSQYSSTVRVEGTKRL
jgi:hypothetical protein